MELKEYIAIFQKRINLILVVLLMALAGGVVFKALEPVRYEARVNLNVTRKGIQKTPDYRFDSFYRLQADERFADTVVRWLETPQIRTEIIRKGDFGGGTPTFGISAKRLSSQLVDIKIAADDAEAADKLAQGVAPAVNAEAEKLDRIQQDENWFLVVADEPVIRRTEIGWYLVVAISLLGGIFISFWAVLLMHYLEENHADRS